MVKYVHHIEFRLNAKKRGYKRNGIDKLGPIKPLPLNITNDKTHNINYLSAIICPALAVILFFLTIPSIKLQAQDFRNFTSLYKSASTVEEGHLNFRFETIGYFQNNEYLGNFVNGYTLTGAMFRPKLTYSPIAGLYFETGAHLVKYNGMEDFVNISPWFTARYLLSERFAVITGNLDQNNIHGLPEQLWEPELIYSEKPEAGLQFVYTSKRLEAQTWVSWEQFIQKGDPFQEHFTFGLAAQYKALDNKSLAISFPINLLMYHKGGEINTSPNGVRPKVQTNNNTLTGCKLDIKIDRKIKAINLNTYWMGWNAGANSAKYVSYDKGHALLFETVAQLNRSNFSINYWNGFQFIAPKGRMFYQSCSDIDPELSRARRSIVSAKYFWQKNISKDARVAFQVEAYNDMDTNDLSYSYGFFLLFTPEFMIKKFR